uniref:Uncharacterized protein n=1 Tax=Mucochytrium quahogii TaxID=96639 RepID=A0A7S2SJ51_9STRA|mmetsp:Transcript_6721/g.15013  ORF Transcript_6721/g.15013 Transcript_6721/m.15013 type:complete len:209 (+) Transcript_6721:97-723(+)
MFIHCLKSVAVWRDSAQTHVPPDAADKMPSWVYNFVCAFFCHGFGGTHFRDWAVAKPPGIFTNPDLPKTWALAFALVYFSPFDVVFQLINTPGTVTSLCVTSFEAIDSATTICGSVEKGRTLFPKSPLAPFVVALFGGVGGSVFRYFERKFGRGWTDHEIEWYAPSEVFGRTVVYTCVYMYLSRAYGISKARLWVTYFHVVYSLVLRG